MRELLWVTGLAGAALCLAGHLPGPVRRWGPHAVALAAMTATAPGADVRELLLACAATASACAWSARGGCAARSVDLAVMAVLTAAMVPSHGPHAHADGSWPLPLFFLACWAVARAGAMLFTRIWRDAPAPPGRTPLLGETGGLLMIAGMAGMLG